MSIDARISGITLNEDGSGVLRLRDRPPGKDGVPGIAGQRSLEFGSCPPDVSLLLGKDVWGNDSSIMLGIRRIARRESYGGIEFLGGTVEEKLAKEAIRKL